MLPFGVTIPVTVPQRSEIPEGLMNNPLFIITTPWCKLTVGILKTPLVFSLGFANKKFKILSDCKCLCRQHAACELWVEWA
jgi:hypothetical protein